MRRRAETIKEAHVQKAFESSGLPCRKGLVPGEETMLHDIETVCVPKMFQGRVPELIRSLPYAQPAIQSLRPHTLPVQLAVWSL